MSNQASESLSYFNFIEMMGKIHKAEIAKIECQLHEQGYERLAPGALFLMYRVYSDKYFNVHNLNYQTYGKVTNLNYILRSLEEKGYITVGTDGRDRRRRHLFLTEKGGKYCVKLQSIMENIRQQLNDKLQKIVGNESVDIDVITQWVKTVHGA